MYCIYLEKSILIISRRSKVFLYSIRAEEHTKKYFLFVVSRLRMKLFSTIWLCQHLRNS